MDWFKNTLYTFQSTVDKVAVSRAGRIVFDDALYDSFDVVDTAGRGTLSLALGQERSRLGRVTIPF